ncbi:MAG: hypothetical protein JKY34_12700 [Kordiimonadaceae bacterium]|nr:hypothetical protein [Kordiimonadaceae bacterium]
MAKTISGEVTLKHGARKIRLRLDVGVMMDLEDHFDMGLVPFLANRLPEFRLTDLAVLYLAMTGKEYDEPEKVKAAAATVMKIGLMPVATAIGQVFEATLMPETPGK